MKKLDIVSAVIFFAAAIFYFVFTFITKEMIPSKLMINTMIIVSIIGLILAFLSKGRLKTISIIGNLLVLLLIGVLPIIIMNTR